MSPVSAEDALQDRGRPWGGGWMLLLTAVIAIGTLVGGVSTYLALDDDDPPAGPTAITANPTATTGLPVGGGSSGTSAPPATPPVRAEGTVLGRDLRPSSSETCRKPTFATGSAWDLTAVTLGGTTYEAGYSCNLFSQATGSLDFDIGGRFTRLRLAAGFAADSAAILHRVRFEIIGDGRFQIADRTIAFGDVAVLDLDVSGISRLRMKITETGASGADESPSRPVWANAALS